MFGGKADGIASKHGAKEKFNKLIKTTSCVCQIEGEEYVTSAVPTEDNGSMMVQINDIKKFTQLLWSKDLEPEDYKSFLGLCSFFPTRTKGGNYQKNCIGLLDTTTRDYILSNIDWYFKVYTAENVPIYAILNVTLLIDPESSVYDRFLPTLNIKTREFIRSLKLCIGWQHPKYTGIVYRGAWLNPLELWTYKFKGIFYISQFVSTSTDINVVRKTFKGNTIFEIDISFFNNFTTLIQDTQTTFKGEKECLISCYNIYEYCGARLEKDAVIVGLRLLDYNKLNNTENHIIEGVQHGNVPDKFVKSGSDEIRNKRLTPDKLFYVFNQLVNHK